MADSKKSRAEDKPELNVPSTAALDLERRLENDNAPGAGVLTVNAAGVEEASVEDYRGTDPIYQNHANDTEKPLAAGKGVFKDAEELHDKHLVAEAQDTPEELKQLYKDRSTNLDPDADDDTEEPEPKATDTNSDEALEAKRAEVLGNGDEKKSSSSGSSGSGSTGSSSSGQKSTQANQS